MNRTDTPHTPTPPLHLTWPPARLPQKINDWFCCCCGFVQELAFNLASVLFFDDDQLGWVVACVPQATLTLISIFDFDLDKQKLTFSFPCRLLSSFDVKLGRGRWWCCGLGHWTYRNYGTPRYALFCWCQSWQKKKTLVRIWQKYLVKICLVPKQKDFEKCFGLFTRQQVDPYLSPTIFRFGLCQCWLLWFYSPPHTFVSVG